MKPLIRLFLLVVCSGFGVCVGFFVGTSLGLGLSEDGIGLFSVDYDRPSNRFDSISLAEGNESPTILSDIPTEMPTEEAIREYLSAKRPANIPNEKFEERVELESYFAQREYSHQVYPNSFWILTIAAGLLGLIAAFFSGRWLWKFLYAHGD